MRGQQEGAEEVRGAGQGAQADAAGVRREGSTWRATRGGENNEQLAKLCHQRNRHPKMKDLYLADLRSWRESGCGLFCVKQAPSTWCCASTCGRTEGLPGGFTKRRGPCRPLPWSRARCPREVSGAGLMVCPEQP